MCRDGRHDALRIKEDKEGLLCHILITVERIYFMKKQEMANLVSSFTVTRLRQKCLNTFAIIHGLRKSDFR